MKKRIISLLTVFLLLTACAADQPAEVCSSTGSMEHASDPVQADTSLQPDAGAAKPIDPLEPFAPSAAAEQTVLVDESDIRITATGLEYTSYSVRVNLMLENNTDQNLSFHSGTVSYACNSVNGYMVSDGYLNTDVAAGKKANVTVSFSVDELTLLGITDIADIELGFRITDDQYDEYLETGPRQIRTSLADSYDYAVDTYRKAITSSSLALNYGFTVDYDSTQEIILQEGVRAVSQTLATNSDGKPMLFVELENTFSETVYVSASDIFLNGLSVQSGTWTTDWVSSGKRCVMSLSLSSMLDTAYWEVYGLNEPGTFTCTLTVKDSDRNALSSRQIVLSVPGRGTSYDGSGEVLYQDGGLRIISKGLVPDSSQYSDDVHFLILVENGSLEELQFDVDSSSVSVNGYMTAAICYSVTVAPGAAGILDLELQDSSMKKNGITALEDITEVEMTFEIRNSSYRKVAEPTAIVTVSR